MPTIRATRIQPTTGKSFFTADNVSGGTELQNFTQNNITMSNGSGSGSNGFDYSPNKPPIPLTSDYVLLVTIPANPTRFYIEVQNQDTAILEIVRDDGSGNNVSVILLDVAASSPGQGGDWSSDTFLGRLKIYGATEQHFFAAFED